MPSGSAGKVLGFDERAPEHSTQYTHNAFFQLIKALTINCAKEIGQKAKDSCSFNMEVLEIGSSWEYHVLVFLASAISVICKSYTLHK